MIFTQEMHAKFTLQTEVITLGVSFLKSSWVWKPPRAFDLIKFKLSQKRSKTLKLVKIDATAFLVSSTFLQTSLDPYRHGAHATDCKHARSREAASYCPKKAPPHSLRIPQVGEAKTPALNHSLVRVIWKDLLKPESSFILFPLGQRAGVIKP